MAGIDKIYTEDIPYTEYKEFIDWTYNEGESLFKKYCILGKYPYDRILDFDEIEYFTLHGFFEDFTENNYNGVISNLPETVDIFLIEHIPDKFINFIKRLKVQYSDFDKIRKNGHKVFKRPNPYTAKRFKIIYHKGRLLNNTLVNYTVQVDVPRFLDYNNFTQEWIYSRELKPFNGDYVYVKKSSFKSLIRKMRKWKMPKNTIYHIHHDYGFFKIKVI